MVLMFAHSVSLYSAATFPLIGFHGLKLEMYLAQLAFNAITVVCILVVGVQMGRPFEDRGAAVR